MKTASTLALSAAFSAALAQYTDLVTPEALIQKIELDDLLAGAQKLQDFADENGGTRAFGGGGHNATVDWLYDTLVETGFYDVYKQPFVELYTSAQVQLSVDGEDFVARYMTYGPSGNATASLVQVNNIGCTAVDYPADVSGNIALISRGECPFGEKAALAKAAGAVAAVIYNNVEGALTGTLGGEGDYAPTLGVSQEIGQTLQTKLGTETTVYVDAIEENRTTYNVIAETKAGDHDNVLVLGGHTDSVPDGPGINDNGSGTIGVLNVAKALAGFAVNNAVRFAFWSAEEFGLLGSEYYLKSINGTISGNASEVAKVRAYLNFDMIASPNYVLSIYDGDGNAFNLSGPPGSDTIERDFELFYDSQNSPHVPTIFSGRSDYGAFLENGIPSGGLFTGAEVAKTEEEAELFGGEAGVAYDENYHQAGDTFDNLAHDAFLLNTQSIANSVAKYAVDFEGIPGGNSSLRKRSGDMYRMTARAAGEAHAHRHAGPCGRAIGSDLL